jgi:biopolymer transport protein ExbD
MAEISSTKGHAGKAGRPRMKKRSTHLDMTPMVDLAFLLLTFFMLAATFSKPKVMEISMPDKHGDITPARKVIRLLPGEGDRLAWYKNDDIQGMKILPFTSSALRELIRKEKAGTDSLYVQVKPADNSSYGQLVGIMDELRQAHVSKYAIAALSEREKQEFQNHR